MNVYMPKYTDAGVLEPLDSYIEKDGIDKSKWVPSMMELYSDKGIQYGMPKGMDVVVVAFNKSIFDKYGVTYPQEGWTWEEFVNKGSELRDKIAKQGGDEYALAIEVDESQPSYTQMLIQEGLKIYSDDGKSTDLSDPKAASVFADLVNLMDEKIMPEYTVLSDTKATDLFISEKAGMLYVGSWKSSVLDGVSFAKNIGLVPMPKRLNNNCALGGISYSMSAYSKNKEAAWKLISYLSGPESNKIQAEEKIEIPAYIEVQDTYAPAFENIDGSIFIEQSKSAVKYPVHRALSNTMQAMSDNASAIFSKQVSPEEGTANMAKDVQNAIDEYNATMK
jgi:multiple sugar transport system substrate-binding protein